MISIFGWKLAKSTTVTKPEITCVKCQTQSGLNFDVYAEYLHIFWVPCFAMKKVVFAQCSKCGTNIAEPEFPSTYKQVGSEIKQQAKIPLWTFIGFPIFVYAFFAAIQDRFGFGAPAVVDNSAKIKTCLEHIAPGQVYEWNLGPPSYSRKEVKTLIKVTQLEGEMVSFEQGLMERHLDKELLNDQAAHVYNNMPQTISKAEFSQKAFLDCQ